MQNKLYLVYNINIKYSNVPIKIVRRYFFNKLYNCKYLMTASFYLDRRIVSFNAITIFYDLRDYKRC